MSGEEETSIAEDIQRYYLWVLSAIGIPANILALIVISTMQKMTTATFLVTALLVCDSCALVSKLVYINLDIHEVLSEVVCKMESISLFFSSLANWTLVLICVERFVSVCFPLKKEYLVTLKLCYVIFGVIGVILLMCYVPIFIIMRYYYEDSYEMLYGPVCSTHDDYVTFWSYYWHWINNSVMLFLPYITVITLTTVIIVKMKVNALQRRKTFYGSSSDSSPNINININSFNSQILKDNERAEKVLTLMLTFTAVLFLVLTLPSCVYYLIYPGSATSLFKQIQYLLFDSTHALNFFMYFLTAKRFRLQLFQILRCERLKELVMPSSDETNETPI